jgi:molybdopterin molybdotransferase
MISVEEALRIILDTPFAIPTEKVPLIESYGAVIQQEVHADRDLPPYDRVTMDGIAIDYTAYAQGQRIFPFQSQQAAGAPQQTLQDPTQAIEIMTGASCPIGTDTVIKVEDLEVAEDDQGNPLSYRILDVPIRQGQNIHYRGTDSKKGKKLIEAGTRIEAPEIAIAASNGLHEVQVKRPPAFAIISTGDELVEIAAQPLPHQIRRSNGYMLQAALKPHGGKAETFHLVDDPALLEKELAAIMERFPVLILSGGVSKGKFDYVPAVMEKLGVNKLFHKVAQRPGKPFWFGATPDSRNVVFALPGNPVSCFVNFHRYVLPWLSLHLGLPPASYPPAKLKEDFFFKPALTYFLQVKTEIDGEGQTWATPLAGHGSGDFANLLQVDALLELPSDRNEFKAGETYPLIRFRA